MLGDQAHLFSSSLYFPVQIDFSGGVRVRVVPDWRGIPIVLPHGFDEVPAGARVRIAKRFCEADHHMLKLVHPTKGTTVDYAIRCLFNPPHRDRQSPRPVWAFLEMAPGLPPVGRVIPPWVVVSRLDRDTIETLPMAELAPCSAFISRIVEQRLSSPPEAIAAAFGDMPPWTNPDWRDPGNLHRVCVACLAASTGPSGCDRCRPAAEVETVPTVPALATPALGGVPLARGHELKGEYTIRSVLYAGQFRFTYEAVSRQYSSKLVVHELFPPGARRDGRGVTVKPASPVDQRLFRPAVQDFLRKARAQVDFECPSFIKAVDAFEENGTAYSVHLQRGAPTLEAWLATQSSQPSPADVLRIANELLTALDALHGAGALHLGLAPDTILIETYESPCGKPRGVVRGTRILISDTAVITLAAPWRERQAGLLPHSAYSAPEAYAVPERCGRATDLYGVGAALYHCLHGAPPPAALDRVAGTALAAVSGPTLKAYPPELLDLIDALLRLRSADRPRSAAVAIGRLASSPRRTTTHLSDDPAGPSIRYFASDRVEVAPFGTAVVSSVIQNGSDHLVLRAALDRRDTVVKVPLPGPPTGLGEIVGWQGGTLPWIVSTHFDAEPYREHDARMHRRLLEAECRTLRDNADAWRLGEARMARFADFHRRGIGYRHGDRVVQAPTDWPCLVMPFHEGTTLARQPPGRRADLFRRMLPALWRALEGRPHGDLSASNLLIDPDGARFRLLDPAVCIADGDINSNDRYVVFTANTLFYPLLLPFIDAEAAQELMAVAAGGEPQRLYRLMSPTWMLANAMRHLGVAPDAAMVQALPALAGRPSRDVDARRPVPADMQAMGLLLFHFVTGETLFVPDLIDTGGWVDKPSHVPMKMERCVKAIRDGYLDARLRAVGDDRIAALVRRLVMLDVRSADDLAALI